MRRLEDVAFLRDHYCLFDDGHFQHFNKGQADVITGTVKGFDNVDAGSNYAIKPSYHIQYRDQSESIPELLRQRLIHMRCPRIPPRASTIER